MPTINSKGGEKTILILFEVFCSSFFCLFVFVVPEICTSPLMILSRNYYLEIRHSSFSSRPFPKKCLETPIEQTI